MFDSWTRFEVKEFDDFRKLPGDSGIYGVFAPPVLTGGHKAHYTKLLNEGKKADAIKYRQKILKSDRVLYIGKSVRLRSRWWAGRGSFFFEPHKMTDHILEDGCYMKYKLMNKLEAAHLELDLINQIKPIHNIMTV